MWEIVHTRYPGRITRYYGHKFYYWTWNHWIKMPQQRDFFFFLPQTTCSLNTSQLFATYRPKAELKKLLPTLSILPAKGGTWRIWTVNQTEASAQLPSRENLATTVCSWCTRCLDKYIFFYFFHLWQVALRETEAALRIWIHELLLTSHLACRSWAGRVRKEKENSLEAQELSCAPSHLPALHQWSGAARSHGGITAGA